MDSVHRYYEQRSLLPTFADFRDEAALNAYEHGRRRLFFEKLFVPAQLFRGADVLQYGPDTGEDALVFARWGARLTIVEPHAHATDIVRKYFEKFGLAKRIAAIENTDLESFSSEQRFDFIDAEGFIYTLRPLSLWLSRFRQLLIDDGLFLITYYETTGAFVELCTKAFHVAGIALSSAGSLETARALYQTKWDSIAHTRAFESWAKDVLDNPFVRRGYFFDAAELCSEAAEHGFELYSSWPTYHDPLQTYWHKRYLDPATLRSQIRHHIERSALSFVTGQKLYLVDEDLEKITDFKRALDEVGSLVDDAIGKYEPERCQEIASKIEAVGKRAASLKVFGDEGAREEGFGLLESLARGFTLAASREWTGLRAFANSDPTFLRNWGLPYHPAVFRRLPGG